MKKTPAKIGRPTLLNDELAATICDQLADGNSLREICRKQDMPHRGTVYRWLSDDPAFRDQYARAREVQAHSIYDEIVSIEKLVKAGKIGAQDARVLIDSMKWRAGKMSPRRYGDRVEIEHRRGPDVHIHACSDEALEKLRQLTEQAEPTPKASPAAPVNPALVGEQYKDEGE